MAVVGAAGLIVGGSAGYFYGSSVSQAKIEQEASEARRELSGKVAMYDWSNNNNPFVFELFQDRTGVKVVYDVFDSDDEAFAKLEAGGSGYDVVVLTDKYVRNAIERGYVRKLDKELIPNLKYLDPKFRELEYDPGNNYSVPYGFGSTAIGLNSDEVKDLRSWKQFFDPNYLQKYRKKFSMLEDPPEVVFATKLYLGKELDDWSDSTMEEVKEALIKQKPYIAGYFSTDKYLPGLENGSLLAAHAYNGDVLTMKYGDGFKNISYLIPEEGAIAWIDNLLVPKDAPNPEAAQALINYLIDPLVAAYKTISVYIAMPIPATKKLLPPELAEEPALIPPPDLMKRLYLSPVMTDEKRAKINDIWEQVLAA